jgi:phage-related protein
MPQVEVILYREDDGTAPLLNWLASLQDEARDRCLAKLTLLEEKGHELRRPHAEYLGDDLYEPRVKFYRINYRLLYFFHGRHAAVVSHGFAKEREIPKREVKLARERMEKFKRDSQRHTFYPEE